MATNRRHLSALAIALDGSLYALLCVGEAPSRCASVPSAVARAIRDQRKAG